MEHQYEKTFASRQEAERHKARFHRFTAAFDGLSVILPVLEQPGYYVFRGSHYDTLAHEVSK